MSSMMTVERASWDRNDEYTCQVQHLRETFSPKTSRAQSLDKPCLEVTLNRPKVKELFINNQAVLDCLITGGERAAVEGARVTWTVNGTESLGSDRSTTQDGHLFTRTSTLTLAERRWFGGVTVQCSVQQIHGNLPPIRQYISHTSGSESPKLFITKLPKEDDHKFVHLICWVTYLSPRDIYVMWSVNNGSYEEGVTSEPVQGATGTFSVASLFRVSAVQWEKYSVVRCHAKHMGNGGSPNTTSLSRADVSVSDLEMESVLNCNDEGEEEDELGSLWSTSLSFITLFLCSLIYSTVLSLIKMKL
ncbi:hypothetical protein GJAV_G00236660 [Gymnothorax javanicus]|nr:hypothetical protein GJAV_G00236660 [Gymnothorax javanicus]